jgi:hypothetical protein
MRDLLDVASSGRVVMLGWQGQDAKDRRCYRQDESKRKEDTAGTDESERGFSDRSGGSGLATRPCLGPGAEETGAAN